MKNYINITGRLGQPPIVKTLPSGTTVTELSIVTTESWKDSSGVKQERSDWHRCTAFGKVGENIAKYFDRGDVIELTGKLQYDKWMDKYEQNRTTAKIIVSQFEFPMTQKPREHGSDESRREEQQETLKPGSHPATTSRGDWPGEGDDPPLEIEADDDLPF